MRRYLTRNDSQKFIKWLETQAPSELIFTSRTTHRGPSGDYEITEEFLKPNRSLAFGYTINSARTEARVFTDF